MSRMRGLILIVFGVLALARGFTLHGERAWLAYAFGAVSLGMGAWRVMRRPDATRL